MTRKLLVGVAALCLVAGCGVVPPPHAFKAAHTPAPVAEVRQVADPVRVRIPSIGVDAVIEPLLVNSQGVLPPPSGHDVTGWWSQGPEPGEPGPAVITGHVNSVEGPSVFARLSELEAGAEILVDRADGITAVFVAQRSETHSKQAGEFPTQAVYGDTPGPELRLVTCGGAFDSVAGRYTENVIVWAIPA